MARVDDGDRRVSSHLSAYDSGYHDSGPRAPDTSAFFRRDKVVHSFRQGWKKKNELFSLSEPTIGEPNGRTDTSLPYDQRGHHLRQPQLTKGVRGGPAVPVRQRPPHPHLGTEG